MNLKRNNQIRDRLAACWLAGGILLTAFFLIRGLPTDWLQQGRAHASSAAPLVSDDSPSYRNIEDIRVGQRVLAHNPDLATSEDDNETVIDRNTWRLLKLRIDKEYPDGTVDASYVETLQPPEWIERQGAEVGKHVAVPLDLIEMGFDADVNAEVVAIEPCPPIKSGPGRVVLTTINHLNDYVFELTVEHPIGRRESIRPTGFHKFYSVTRNDWVSAESLELGEQIAGRDGDLTIIATRRVPGRHCVYNITVDNEHVYFVSRLDALAHNNDCDAPMPLGKFLEGDDVAEAAAHARDVGPVRGIVDRPGASARRRENLKNTPPVPTKDRDEFPPAVIRPIDPPEASVKPINRSHNRRSGAKLKGELPPDGTPVIIFPPPNS